MEEGKEILFQLAMIYLFARAGGFISQKFNQPVVLGEMLMGIIIGPSVLKLFHMSEVLHVFSELGVILLMFIAGLETNLEELKASGKSYTVIAIGGVLVPFAMGYLACFAFGITSFASAGFIGLVLTATSVSITVQTLRELKQLRSKQGMGILGAAIIDDVFGIILLAIFLGVTTGTGNILGTIIHMITYFVVVFVLGFLFQRIINNYGYNFNLSGSMTIVGLIICLLLAYYAEKAEIAAITGAYLAGVILSSTSYKSKIANNVEIAAYLIFTPIFFVGIGMSVEVTSVGSNILFVLVMLFVAISSKVIGSGVGARIMGYTNKHSLQIGVGMASRGEVALIIITIGLKQGLITAGTFSVMVLTIILTALITPSLLNLSFKGEETVDDILASKYADDESEEYSNS